MTSSASEFHQRVHQAGYCFAYLDEDLDEDFEEVQFEPVSEEWFDLSRYHEGSRGLRVYLATIPSNENTYVEKSTKDWPGLFLEFANSPLTQEGILSFANNWGLLGDQRFFRSGTDDMSVRRFKISNDEKSSSFVLGEPLYIWLSSIHLMRHKWRLWTQIRDRNEEMLAQWVKWTSHAEVKCFNAVVASPEYCPERLERMPVGALLQPAAYLLQDAFTRWNPLAQGGVSAHLVWDHDRNGFGIKITPADLMGALWLQLASAVSGHSDFRQCAECARWLEISAGSGRPEKIYCSNACRMRAYRKRKAQGSRRKTRKTQRSP